MYEVIVVGAGSALMAGGVFEGLAGARAAAA
jgi:hypothetical protein